MLAFDKMSVINNSLSQDYPPPDDHAKRISSLFVKPLFICFPNVSTHPLSDHQGIPSQYASEEPWSHSVYSVNRWLHWPRRNCRLLCLKVCCSWIDGIPPSRGCLYGKEWHFLHHHLPIINYNWDV